MNNILLPLFSRHLRFLRGHQRLPLRYFSSGGQRLSAPPANKTDDVPFYGSPRHLSAGSLLPLKRFHVALQGMKEKMLSHPVGSKILHNRPKVGKETLPIDQLIASSKLVSDDGSMTFGQAYGKFLEGHGFDPDERNEVTHIEDAELAYIMLRYRQCHDFWHVLTGLPSTLLGELGLKGLELFQTGLPVAALSATVGSFRLEVSERKILNDYYLP